MERRQVREHPTQASKEQRGGAVVNSFMKGEIDKTEAGFESQVKELALQDGILIRMRETNCTRIRRTFSPKSARPSETYIDTVRNINYRG